MRLKFAVTAGRSGGTLIKGEMSGHFVDGLYPGFSASGQDVWVGDAHYRATRGIVVSAVGARCGKCFKADGDWTAIANTMVLIPKQNFDRDYLWYVFNDEQFWEKGGTAQPYIRFAESLNREWHFPRLAEQTAIADFLDREAAEADALVAKYERLIDLLEEKRVALITQAVTKGLNPSVPMKDSGVEWIGEIPNHWNAVPLKYHAQLKTGHTPSRNVAEYWQDCNIPWVSLSDVSAMRDGTQTYVTITKERISELGLANSAAELLPANTVILSRTASVGFAAIISKPMATTQDFVNWVCGEKIAPEFLLHVFRGMKQEFARLTNGSVHQTIYMPDVAQFHVPLPPPDEQREIAAFLARTTGELFASIASVAKAIALVQEHRSALITAAVTGQIDVRTYRSKKKSMEVPA